MTDSAWQSWFQSIWETREEQVYRQLFGDIGQKIHTVPEHLFRGLGQSELDPRWLVHGVLECPSSLARPNWVYVTSALSNPWGVEPEKADPNGPSGLGMELMLQTPTRSPWAITVLHWLTAVQLLVAEGKLQGELLNPYDRVPMGISLDPHTPSELRHLITAPPKDFPPQFQLPSGKVDLLLCVGITDQELEFARTQGTPALIEALAAKDAFPLTEARRGSVL